jgi:transcriptional regulator with XRE-family HTH domain
MTDIRLGLTDSDTPVRFSVVSKELPPNRLLELYENAAMRRSEVAALCKVGERSVYRWERGEVAIPDEHKLALAQFFGVSPEHLMGWDRQPIDQGRASVA